MVSLEFNLCTHISLFWLNIFCSGKKQFVECTCVDMSLKKKKTIWWSNFWNISQGLFSAISQVLNRIGNSLQYNACENAMLFEKHCNVRYVWNDSIVFISLVFNVCVCVQTTHSNMLWPTALVLCWANKTLTTAVLGNSSLTCEVTCTSFFLCVAIVFSSSLRAKPVLPWRSNSKQSTRPWSQRRILRYEWCQSSLWGGRRPSSIPSIMLWSKSQLTWRRSMARSSWSRLVA